MKNKKETFTKGVVALMISQVLVKVLGLVYRLYLTNREGFGDKGNAIFGAGFQIYALLLTLSSFGVPSAVAKLVSEKIAKGDTKGAHRIFKIALAFFSIVGLIGTVALLLGAKYIANVWLQIPEAVYTLVALSPSLFFAAVSAVFRGYCNGREKLSVNAKSQTYEQLFKAVFTIILVEVAVLMFGTNTTIMAVGANLSTTVSTALCLVYLGWYYKKARKEIWKDTACPYHEPERKRTIIKNIIGIVVPTSISSILSSIGTNIDAVTVVRGLTRHLGAEAAKVQYGILSGKVDTLTTLPLFFSGVFATAIIPAIATAIIKKDTKTITNKIEFTILLTILLGLPCAFGMCILAGPILNLLFPNAPQGAVLLAISSFAIIFSVIGQTINGALVGLGKYLVPAYALAAGIGLKLILNSILIPIPWIGANGAAIASVVCNLVAFVISFIVLIKTIKLTMPISTYVLKPIIATTIMSICTALTYIILCNITKEKIATIVAIIIAVVAYVCAVILLKIFKKEEILMIPYGSKIYNILLKLGIYKERKVV